MFLHIASNAAYPRHSNVWASRRLSIKHPQMPKSYIHKPQSIHHTTVADMASLQSVCANRPSRRFAIRRQGVAIHLKPRRSRAHPTPTSLPLAATTAPFPSHPPCVLPQGLLSLSSGHGPPVFAFGHPWPDPSAALHWGVGRAPGKKGGAASTAQDLGAPLAAESGAEGGLGEEVGVGL